MTTTDPFRIEGPAIVSFSGGRTSGYLLRRIIDAHGGGLPSDVHVCFANTGKERSETLDFVNECATRWGVRVHWVEWVREIPRYREVNYGAASRNGEPFAGLIEWKRYLPNPIQRLCTQHLKIETIKRFAVMTLGLDHWTAAIGIRHDEPRRWRIAGQDKRNRREFKVLPLVDARIAVADVMAFWAAQPFDLQLQSHEGNCDLCFLKARATRAKIMRDRPDLAEWWIEQERATGALVKKPSGARFRASGPDYRRQLRMVQEQPLLPFTYDDADEDALPCACTD